VRVSASAVAAAASESGNARQIKRKRAQGRTHDLIEEACRLFCHPLYQYAPTCKKRTIPEASGNMVNRLLSR
jgi:hypothetical protein